MLKPYYESIDGVAIMSHTLLGDRVRMTVYENGVAVAVHMAESPVACLAAVHTAAAMHNVLALEFHSVDVPWWADMVTGINNPIFENGFIKVPEKPGIGFDELNEEVIREHINPQIPSYFEPTDEWNKEFSNDRIWS